MNERRPRGYWRTQVACLGLNCGVLAGELWLARYVHRLIRRKWGRARMVKQNGSGWFVMRVSQDEMEIASNDTLPALYRLQSGVLIPFVGFELTGSAGRSNGSRFEESLESCSKG